MSNYLLTGNVKILSLLVVVAHAFNPSIQRQRPVDLWEFKDSLDYRVSSRIAIETLSRKTGKKKKKKTCLSLLGAPRLFSEHLAVSSHG